MLATRERVKVKGLLAPPPSEIDAWHEDGVRLEPDTEELIEAVGTALRAQLSR